MYPIFSAHGLECGETFASLRDAVDADGVEMLFSTSRIAGELDRVFFLRASLVRDLPAGGARMVAKASGISHVVVNGAVAIRQGRVAVERAGRFLPSRRR